MATLDYIDVPASASRLRAQSSNAQSRDPHHVRRASRIVTSLPHPPPPMLHRRTDSASSITSPVNLLPQLLLSSLPSGPPPSKDTPASGSKQATSGKPTLLSTRDPLSVPILTVNFKRFVERVGPVFWLQDRIEEVVLWKRGWKVTGVWIAAYAFFCYFPRLLLLLPQITLIGIMLATHPETTKNKSPAPNQTSGDTATAAQVPAPPSVDWQTNIQAIQNLMGFVADAESLLRPYLPHLAHRSPYSPHLLVLLLLTLPLLIALVSLPAFPLRAVCLFIGIAPLVCTHPVVGPRIPAILAFLNAELLTLAQGNVLFAKLQRALKRKLGASSYGGMRSLRAVAVRAMDDANLTDECWVAPMREVELFENERFGAADTAQTQQEWSKANLRDGERTGWTRGRDGWSGVGGSGGGGVSSNLTFSLDPGWAFVTTEDWRADIEARWALPLTSNGDANTSPPNEDGVGAQPDPQVGDEDGWVYTNDAWTEQRPSSSSYAPSVGGVTRRRRWVRRVWFDHARAVAMS